MTPLVALLCPGEYKSVFIPAKTLVADFSGPAEEFLYLTIAYITHFVSQVTNVRDSNKDFPYKVKELCGTSRLESEELINRSGFAFHCCCQKCVTSRG